MKPETVQVSKKFPCSNCGAYLTYAPGKRSLECAYCGTTNTIAESENTIEELDIDEYLRNEQQAAPKMDLYVVKCEGCGAETTLKENRTSDQCPFCSTPLIVKQAALTEEIKPGSILPFQIDRKQGESLFTKWISSKWFAPNDLKKYAVREKLKGVYIPYWTYDFETVTDYKGRRGDDYHTIESYTATENGRSVERTRTVTRTSWSSAWGTVRNKFNDILVIATRSLPEQYARKLEPWGFESLVPYDENYIAGFVCETYQVGLREGLEKAKHQAEDAIRQSVRRDIGGDRQEISDMKSAYSEITFKHTLLPVWLSAYQYRGKVYRFLVNGQTGEIQGESPYSWIKITLLVLGILILAGVILMVTQ